ncbi:MAG: hypothetical protein ABI193_13445 [Minicystis sp.]
MIDYALAHRNEIVAAQERAHAAWRGARAVGLPADPILMTNLDHLPPPIGADEEFMWGADVSVMCQKRPCARCLEPGASMPSAKWAGSSST